MTTFTPHMKLVIPEESQNPWTEDMDNNLTIIDSIMGQFIAIPGFIGAWDNSYAYSAGQVVVEVPASTLWEANETHTSAPVPTTFAQDRAANVGTWTKIGGSGFVVPDAVKKSGDTMSGRLTLQAGLGFYNVVVSSPTDLSEHISLFGNNYGLSITSGALNVVAGGSINHYIGGPTSVNRLAITGAGATITGVIAASLDIAAGRHITANSNMSAAGSITAGTQLSSSGGLSVSGSAAINGDVTIIGNANVYKGGWIYKGIAGGGNAIGFHWTGSQLDAYIDGTRIGKITIT